MLENNSTLSVTAEKSSSWGLIRTLLENKAEILFFLHCTLSYARQDAVATSEELHENSDLVESCLQYLQENDFISVTEDNILPTQLGCATVGSSMSPDEALYVYKDLKKAKSALVTPIFLIEQVKHGISWTQYYDIWRSLESGQRRVGMVVAFCDRLGWFTFKTLLCGFSERLAFGVKRDLTELVQIDGIDGLRARRFHEDGITTIAKLAQMKIREIAKVFSRAVPFESSSNGGEKSTWLAGHSELSLYDAAEFVRKQARCLLSDRLRGFGLCLIQSDEKGSKVLQNNIFVDLLEEDDSHKQWENDDAVLQFHTSHSASLEGNLKMKNTCDKNACVDKSPEEFPFQSQQNANAISTSIIQEENFAIEGGLQVVLERIAYLDEKAESINWSNGNEMSPFSRSKILDSRNNIEDSASNKLLFPTASDEEQILNSDNACRQSGEKLKCENMNNSLQSALEACNDENPSKTGDNISLVDEVIFDQWFSSPFSLNDDLMEAFAKNKREDSFSSKDKLSNPENDKQKLSASINYLPKTDEKLDFHQEIELTEGTVENFQKNTVAKENLMTENQPDNTTAHKSNEKKSESFQHCLTECCSTSVECSYGSSLLEYLEETFEGCSSRTNECLQYSKEGDPSCRECTIASPETEILDEQNSIQKKMDCLFDEDESSGKNTYSDPLKLSTASEREICNALNTSFTSLTERPNIDCQLSMKHLSTSEAERHQEFKDALQGLSTQQLVDIFDSSFDTKVDSISTESAEIFAESDFRSFTVSKSEQQIQDSSENLPEQTATEYAVICVLDIENCTACHSKLHSRKSTKISNYTVAVCWDLQNVYVLTGEFKSDGCEAGENDKVKLLKMILTPKDSSKVVVFYNLRKVIPLLFELYKNEAFEFQNRLCLTTASWILNPDGSYWDAKALLTEYSPHDLNILQSSWYSDSSNSSTSCFQSAATNVLYPKIFEILKKKDLWNAFLNIELPAQYVVGNIESAGIGFNVDLCMVMSTCLKNKLNELEAEAAKEAGHRFSLNSPKEVSKVLFYELQLPPPDESKVSRRRFTSVKQYSTAKHVLENLAQLHPLPDVTRWLIETTEKCRSRGFCVTLANRVRYFAAIRSSATSDKLHAERQAINTTVQGSASDIFKIALRKVYLALDDYTKKNDQMNNAQTLAKIIFQIHDELMLEVTNSNVEAVATIVKHSMETAVSLRVELPPLLIPFIEYVYY
ncbi:hypothetical protein D917_01204 [Trichinella nativa]|uniref:DNA-directed DNA polymerase family A palm domain-containing protein n=1 Tax=Trichinella nativa TaxID=6335 RepID=A0A1Y3EU48_9BILA|nr:hypothetical protein D917_01204 [Trichinella nativa]